MQKHAPFVAIAAVYLIVASLFAVYTPDWQAPDEPAHYNYIRQLAAGKFPVMEPSDYGQAYQSAVIASKFDPQYSIEPFSYEDYQPPLYYLLQTPIFWLSGGKLRFLRLFSVLLGLGTLTLAYGVTGYVFKEKALRLTAVAFIAFLPQHVAMQAAVNNDALSELIIAALLLLLFHRLADLPNHGERSWGWVGVVLGLGFLTKATVYLMAPIIGLVLLRQYWGDWTRLRRSTLYLFGPALLLGAVWWVRNLWVYGWPDFMGIRAHDAAVVGQPLTSQWVSQLGLWGTLAAFLRTTFQSFWGQFGWMGVVMPLWIYQLLLIFSVLVGIGFLFLAVHQWKRIRQNLGRFSPVFIILLLLFILNVGLYLTYNLTYVQHQGRYFFSSLIPIGIGVALGLKGWLIAVKERPWLLNLLPALLAIGLVGLDLLALFRFVLPALSLP